MFLNTHAARSATKGRGLAPQFLFRVKPVLPQWLFTVSGAAAGIQWIF